MYGFQFTPPVFKLPSMPIVRTILAIKEEIEKARTWTKVQATDLPSLTYEDGVQRALTWVLGEEDTEPVESEYEDIDD